MEEYWSQSSESGSSCHQFSEDSWMYNSSSPIQNSYITFDKNFCMIQPSHNSQNTNYQDRCYAYNQAFYASSSSSEIEEKPEISEDSSSEGEVRILCKTGQEVNHNLNSNISIHKRRYVNKFIYLLFEINKKLILYH